MTPPDYMALAFGVINVIFALANWMQIRSKAGEDKLTALAGELKTLSSKVEALAGRADAAPSHKDLGAIYDLLNDTRTQLAAMSGSLDHMNTTLRLLLTRQLDGAGN